jgi:hypothetical protein
MADRIDMLLDMQTAQTQSIGRVHRRLDDFIDTHAEMRERDHVRFAKVESDVSGLKVKSGVWGAISGAIVAIAALLMAMAKGVFH